MSEFSKTQVELEESMTLNLQRLRAEPQDRDAKGVLINPVAEIFEHRMNAALDQWKDARRAGRTALLGPGHGSAVSSHS